MKTNWTNRMAGLRCAGAGIALAIAAVATPTTALAQPKAYASGTYRPSTQVYL